MKSYLQMFMASFGVLALMLAGCSSTEVDDTDDGEEMVEVQGEVVEVEVEGEDEMVEGEDSAE